MGRLAGKVVIVTGGASGIGAGASEILGTEGAQVVVADINRDGAERKAASIREGGQEAFAVHVDMGDENSIREMIAAAVRKYGGLDVLFNNAANTQLSSTSDHRIENMDFAVWDELMRVNVRGAAMAIKHAIPHLRARGGGSIVNVASGAALSGMDFATAYGVGKAGLICLTRYVATQHGKEGIRCNAIAPGPIVTPITAESFAKGKPAHDVMLRHTLARRLGTPQDIAWALVWLASDESAFVNGQCINVDGGMQAHQPFWADFAMPAA